MKRIILSLAILCLSVLFGNAQTIHWLTFIDTTDDQVGVLDVNGRKVLYSRFINVINAALAEKGIQSDVQDYYGTWTSPENCKRAIESLKCQPNDIIVFYYIGHGGRPVTDNDNEHPFPQMWMAQDNERKMIPLEWVHNTLKGKGARLTASIGMCCNVKQRLSIKRTPTFSVSYGNVYLDQTQLRSIQNMFLNYQGDLILSSASPGQSSYGGSTPLGDMDLFTALLVTKFEEAATEGTLTWNSLFNSVKARVTAETDGRQTPIFLSSITSNLGEKTQAQPKDKPKEAPLNLNDARATGSLLMQVFDFIIDTQQSLDDRIVMAEKLKSIFSKEAQIKIVGQDGKTVVDKEDVGSFLMRLTTSRILLKVYPMAYKYTTESITMLEVQEYYKKD